LCAVLASQFEEKMEKGHFCIPPEPGARVLNAHNKLAKEVDIILAGQTGKLGQQVQCSKVSEESL